MLAQERKINEMVSGKRYPVILAGDLNAEPASAPINLLGDVWGNSDTPDRMLSTYPSDPCAYLAVLELVEGK